MEQQNNFDRPEKKIADTAPGTKVLRAKKHAPISCMAK